jgi:hypothetical protein
MKDFNGKNNPFYNKKHTEETKRKMSEKKKELYKNGFTNWNKGKINVYSKNTLKKMSESHRGRPASNFKGKGITKDGYIWIYEPNNKNSNKKGYLYEQRKVMSDFLKRPLTIGEQVHHIDGNKQNNKLNNLCLLRSVREHTTLHHQMNKILFELYSIKLVGFNKTQKKYFVIGESK